MQFIRDAMPDLIYGTRSGRDDVNKISFALRPDVDLDALAEARRVWVVGYRNRPVATYLPAGYADAAANDASINHLCAVLRAWGRW